MNADSLKFLKELMSVACPSGFEQAAQRIIRRRMKRYCDRVETDVHGNVYMVKNEDAPLKVMLAGHVDEIGFMLTHIDDKGFLYAAPIGGVDQTMCAGSRVSIHGVKGVVKGVFGKKAIHLMSAEERRKAVTLENLWIDIGARNGREARRRVAVGDYAVYDCAFTELANDIVAARAFDNRIGAFVVAETMRLIARRKLRVAVFGVSTVQEEIGLRGARTSAYRIDPDVGIALDVGHATDHPNVDAKKHGSVKLGGGPVLARGANINPVVDKLLLAAAKKRRIPYQYAAEPGATGTDANAIQVTRAGVAAGLVSIPNRYMHTPVEAVHLKDVENCAKLLAGFVQDLSPRQRFIPE